MKVEITMMVERSPLPKKAENQYATVKMTPADFCQHLKTHGIVMEIDGKSYVFGSESLLHAVKCCGFFHGGGGE